ncbi:putative nuclease YbcO [compost metagenome]
MTRVVSKKLRESARGQDCTLRLAGCRFNPEYTVLCHLPVGQKGIGMKSPDLFACFGCDHCHGIIDGRIPGEFTHADLLRAMAETQLIWIRDGLLVVKGAA